MNWWQHFMLLLSRFHSVVLTTKTREYVSKDLSFSVCFSLSCSVFESPSLYPLKPFQFYHSLFHFLFLSMSLGPGRLLKAHLSTLKRNMS